MANNPKHKDNLVKFGQGQPTNKGGAPKGKRVTTIIKELLETDIKNFNPKLEGMDTNKALAIELITMAFHRDNSAKDKLSAIKEILDRIEGKAVQDVNLNSNEVNPLTFKVIGKDGNKPT